MGGEEADRAAIMRVIEEETAAYFRKDYDGWARQWMHEPYVRRFGSYARGGMLVHTRWEQEDALMRQAMAAFPSPNRSAEAVRRENVSMRVGRDMAWVSFDQIAPKTGDPFDVPGVQHEMRVLEKHKGEWKIVCTCVMQPWIEFVRSPLVRVDGRSHIVWTNAAGAERLKRRLGVMSSGGRLRALDRPSDQRLQALIVAASKPASWSSYMTAQDLSRHGALPVVLGDEGRQVSDICWIIADSGMILVSFNDEDTIERRLAAATLIYGITPAQRKLAGYVVAGLDVVEAAGEMSISVTTARTHLQRMYEKTGVRGQAALVRTLLSVAVSLT